MAKKEIKRLVALLDEAYAGPAWHGPCLRGSLRGVNPKEAAQRPAPRRHSIWELVVHAAYWKYAVRRRLLGDQPGGFGEKGHDWFERASASSAAGGQELSANAWGRDLDLLARSYKELREAVLRLDDSALDRRSPGSRHTPRRMIAGTAMHDVYHAGQIQLLKRLVRQA